MLEPVNRAGPVGHCLQHSPCDGPLCLGQHMLALLWGLCCDHCLWPRELTRGMHYMKRPQSGHCTGRPTECCMQCPKMQLPQVGPLCCGQPLWHCIQPMCHRPHKPQNGDRGASALGLPGVGTAGSSCSGPIICAVSSACSARSSPCARPALHITCAVGLRPVGWIWPMGCMFDTPVVEV